jgi:hypothetical protein
MNRESIEAMLNKYPEKVPVYIHGDKNNIRKNRYLVPREQTLVAFTNSLRINKMVYSTDSVFLFIDNKIPLMTKSMGELYDKYKKDDLILHFTLVKEDVFG